MKICPYISFNFEITVDFNTAPLPDEVAESHAKGFPLMVAWRRYRGLSQKEVAKRAGIPAPTYSNHERKMHKPSEHTLRKIADILEISIKQLVE